MLAANDAVPESVGATGLAVRKGIDLISDWGDGASGPFLPVEPGSDRIGEGHEFSDQTAFGVLRCLVWVEEPAQDRQ